MIDRFINYFALVLIVLFGISIWGTVHYRDKARVAVAERQVLTKALETVQEQRKIDAGVLASRQAELAVQRRKLAAAQAGLLEALQANKTWSDTDVPPEVQKALSGRFGGPVPASAADSGVLNSTGSDQTVPAN
jgi:hypothetical protein